MRSQRIVMTGARQDTLYTLLIGIAGCLAFSSNTSANEAGLQDDKRFEIIRTETPPVIDGTIDDAVWATAAVIDDFVVSEPNEGEEPAEKTQIFVLYDEDALYIAMRAWDRHANGIVAQVLRQGESIITDDDVVIILDPFNNQRSGYLFAVNPNGVRLDALFKNTTQLEFNWDGIYKAATSRDDEGWTAEFEIPFKTLSFDPENDTWGINFRRDLRRTGERYIWAARNRALNPSVTGKAVGFRDIDQGNGLDIVPSFAVNRFKDFSNSVSNVDYNPSLDIFYKITPSLTTSLTINTDFSATEVDDRQVNLTRFGLFFPEKREFFLRDTDIFEFGGIGARAGLNALDNTAASRPSKESGRPFFSRTIGLSGSGLPIDIEVGGKISGRIGRWDVGAMAVRQDEFGTIDASDIVVVRGAANVLRESSVGFILTDGDPGSNLNSSTVGIDFRYNNSRLANGKILQAEAWALQTDTEGLSGDDNAFGFGISMPNLDGWRAGIGYKDFEANYRPSLGFVDRRGVRDHTAALGYTHRRPSGYIRTIYSGIDAQRIEHQTDGLQSETIRVRPLELRNAVEDSLKFNYTSTREVLNTPFEISPGVIIAPGNYSFDQYGFDVSATGARRVSGRLSFQKGDFFGGNLTNIFGELTWVFNPHFRVSGSYNINDVSLPGGDFQTRLVRLKTDVIFSSKWSWVNLIQYDNVSETAALNSRLEWIPEAGREAFIVLNHNLEDFDKDNRFQSLQSEFAVKFSYTIRF